MLNKKKELNQNKEDFIQQIYVTRRKHDDVKRKRFYFFHVNCFYCSNDRTKEKKNRDIDVAKRKKDISQMKTEEKKIFDRT